MARLGAFTEILLFEGATTVTVTSSFGAPIRLKSRSWPSVESSSAVAASDNVSLLELLVLLLRTMNRCGDSGEILSNSPNNTQPLGRTGASEYSFILMVLFGSTIHCELDEWPVSTESGCVALKCRRQLLGSAPCTHNGICAGQAKAQLTNMKSCLVPSATTQTSAQLCLWLAIYP